jgi:hypothetical protein
MNKCILHFHCREESIAGGRAEIETQDFLIPEFGQFQWSRCGALYTLWLCLRLPRALVIWITSQNVKKNQATQRKTDCWISLRN